MPANGDLPTLRPGAGRAGAEVILPDPARFKDVDLQGRVLRNWPIFDPFLTADKIINIPIAKHHSLTGTTLGMKNWYGILGGPRHQLHQKINESLVDLADFVRLRVSETVAAFYDLLAAQDLIMVMEAGQKEALQHEFPAWRAHTFLLSEVTDARAYDIQDPIQDGLERCVGVGSQIQALIEKGFYRICDRAIRLQRLPR